MWQAAIGVLIGYLFALWWVRRDANREIEAIRSMFHGRLEARDEEIVLLRDRYEKSQRAVAAYERRARYLESALTASIDSPPEEAVSQAG